MPREVYYYAVTDVQYPSDHPTVVYTKNPRALQIYLRQNEGFILEGPYCGEIRCSGFQEFKNHIMHKYGVEINVGPNQLELMISRDGELSLALTEDLIENFNYSAATDMVITDTMVKFRSLEQLVSLMTGLSDDDVEAFKSFSKLVNKYLTTMLLIRSGGSVYCDLSEPDKQCLDTIWLSCSGETFSGVFDRDDCIADESSPDFIQVHSFIDYVMLYYMVNLKSLFVCREERMLPCDDMICREINKIRMDLYMGRG